MRRGERAIWMRIVGKRWSWNQGVVVPAVVAVAAVVVNLIVGRVVGEEDEVRGEDCAEAADGSAGDDGEDCEGCGGGGAPAVPAATAAAAAKAVLVSSSLAASFPFNSQISLSALYNNLALASTSSTNSCLLSRSFCSRLSSVVFIFNSRFASASSSLALSPHHRLGLF